MARLKTGLCPALTEDVVQKLKFIGIADEVNFVTADIEQIARKSSVSFKDLLAIRKIILAQRAAFPISGVDLYEDAISSIAILSTSCQSLDQLLDGGIYTGEITELAGGVGSGKTQICMDVAIAVASTTAQNVVYIDTGGGIDMTRLIQILECKQPATGQDDEDILSRICCTHVFDIFELLTELEKWRNSLSQKIEPFCKAVKLIIIDCFASVISPILGGQQTEGQAYMMHAARMMKTLVSEHSVAILLTNNIVRGDGDQMKPALGRSWVHCPNTRLLITRDQPSTKDGYNHLNSKQEIEKRHVRLTASSRQVTRTTTIIHITELGLTSTQNQ